jgi:hypothetical protein
MGEPLVVSCPGCGKRYSVPAGVPPGQFQCQDCSAVVVYGRGAAAGPPAGRAGGGGKHRAKAEAVKRRLARGREEEDEGDGRRGRAAGPAGPPRKDAMPYVMGFVVLAIVVGGTVFAMAGKKDPPPARPSKPVEEPLSVAPPPGTPEAPDPEPRPAIPGTARSPAPSPAPRAEGGIKTAPRAGAAEKRDEFQVVAEPPTGGNYGKSQAAILLMLRDRRAEVVTDLGHLPDTAGDVQSAVDRDVALLSDPLAGRDALVAQDRLIKVGRAAIPRVLGIAAKLDFSGFKTMAEARDACVVADGIDHVLRGITAYATPPQLQFSPQGNLEDYRRSIDEWYVWWLTHGYKRATFYKAAASEEEEKL